MRGFWKKQLPAFLLAMVMVVGLVPAASAADWTGGDGSACEHTATSEVISQAATCSVAGKKIITCTACGAEKTEVIAPTGKHDYGDWIKVDDSTHQRTCQNAGCNDTQTASHDFSTTDKDDSGHWKVCACGAKTAVVSHTYIQNHDASSHWDECSSCGYKTNKGGHIDENPVDGKCDTCGATVHTHSYGSWKTNASSHWRECSCGDIISMGSHVDSDKNGKCDTCGYTMSTSQTKNFSIQVKSSTSTTVGSTLRTQINSYFSGNFSKVTFSSPSGTSYGTLYANSSKKSLTSYEYTYSGGSYPVSSLYFVSTSKAGTYSVSYTAVDSNGSTVSGKISIVVASSAASGKTITYTVDAGDEVSFDRSDFQAAYRREYDSGTIRYVSFETSDTITTSTGTVYYNYNSSGEKSFTKSTIDDYTFYYSSSSYGDYALSNLSFAAPSSADERTVELTYRACYSSSEYVEGTVKIEINGSSSKKGDIHYQVDPGDEVSFSRSDFNDFFQEEYSSYDVRYVVFETSDTITTSTGTVYYNYNASGEKSFTKSTIDDYKFYYDDSDYGDYALKGLSFAAPSNADERTVEIDFTAYYSSTRKVSGTLTIEIGDGGSSSKKGDIHYEVDPGDEVNFSRSDFNDFFQEEYSSYDVRYVVFETSDTISTSTGTVYYNYDASGEKSFTRSTIDDYKFYYDDSDYGDYALKGLSFVAPSNADERTVEIDFTAYYSSTRKVSGTLTIQIGDGAETSSKADITYQASPDEEVSFDRDDFNDFFQEKYSSYTLKYVTFKADSTLVSSNGVIYSDYDGDDEKSFTKSSIDDYQFYYKDDSNGDYALNSLSFVASSSFSTAVTLEFTAWYSDTRYVEGTLRIEPVSTGKGDILYYTTYSTNVQINANDIARFFNKQYPGSTLQYVELSGVPGSGSLYYNYYSVSKYGASKQLKLTSSNCGDQKLYFSPSSTSQYALSELTFVPYGVNYCASIPFKAYGSGSRSVSGTILISVTFSTVSEVYGATPKGTSVSFPAASISTAVSGATGSALGSIQLLQLPSSTTGTVYVGSGTSNKADTSTKYGYSTGTQKISQLRFVPASGFTGSVELPYVAYSSNGNAIASGKFCLGVVNSVKKFSDVTSSTWCYKYVTELSDAKVIDGYQDGSFRPNNTVTYGQALKLIMLAAGYSVQQPTGSHPFSGYLTKAKSDGLVSGNINLDQSITRLAVAQIAAKAMKLSTSNLSNVQPFTDTSDVYVQALNAAGIVEGYFSGGTSTYKPGNTLTRGQISAIVWRMERAG